MLGKSLSKQCSICGKFLDHEEFYYGNRSNRSYCKTCNIAEQKAYSKGGREAAKAFRENMRVEWSS